MAERINKNGGAIAGPARKFLPRPPGTPVSHLFNVGGRSGGGGVRTKAILVTLDSR